MLTRSIFLIRFLIPVLCAQTACLFFHGQRYQHFSTGTPLPERHVLVLGFLGGREPWDSKRSSVRKLAIELRARQLPKVHIETVENKKRELALRLIENAFDRNSDGILDSREKQNVRLILYGQSFGGAAVIKLARTLKSEGIPVLLTIQIDSVGTGDAMVPSNVRKAANFYQNDGWIIQGESPIRAEDPQRTQIIGNFQFDYNGRDIDISHVPWYKKLFRIAHTKMNYDPKVWSKVQRLILEAIHSERKVDMIKRKP